jgi:hypothetical protein
MASAEGIVEARGVVSATLHAELRDAISAVASPIGALANEAGVAMPPVRWCVCDDFIGEVTAHLRSSGGSSAFSAERLGGLVTAKTMPDLATGGHLIALNGTLLADPDAARSLADHVFLAGHELSHVLQTAVRNQSGVMIGAPFPSRTARQSWRSVVRIVADEYRADLIAAQLVSALVTVSPDGGDRRPATIIDTFGMGHLEATEGVVQGLVPKLPDLVDSYRGCEIPLEQLLQGLARFTEQTLTALAHWQATCDVLRLTHDFDVDLPACRASELYVRPLWKTINSAIQQTSILPTPMELREQEPHLLDVGSRAIETMWAAAGVTVTENFDETSDIAVTAPAR